MVTTRTAWFKVQWLGIYPGELIDIYFGSQKNRLGFCRHSYGSYVDKLGRELDWSGSGYGQRAGSCENCHEISDSISVINVSISWGNTGFSRTVTWRYLEERARMEEGEKKEKKKEGIFLNFYKGSCKDRHISYAVPVRLSVILCLIQSSWRYFHEIYTWYFC